MADTDDLILRVRALIRVGRISDARRTLRKFLNQRQDVPEAWALMARIARSREEAIFCLEKLLKLKPGDPWAVNSLLKLRDIKQVPPERRDMPPPNADYRTKLNAAAARLQEELEQDPRQIPSFSFLQDDYDADEDILSDEAIAGLMMSKMPRTEGQSLREKASSPDETPFALDDTNRVQRREMFDQLGINPPVPGWDEDEQGEGEEPPATQPAEHLPPPTEDAAPTPPPEPDWIEEVPASPEPVPEWDKLTEELPAPDLSRYKPKPAAVIGRIALVVALVVVVGGVIVALRSGATRGPVLSSPPIADAHVTVRTAPLRVGDSASTRIDGEFDAHNYLIALAQGQQVSISVTGRDGTNPEVYVYSPDGATILGYDDDSGGGGDSLVTFTPEADGVYIIRVRTWEPGPYTIAVQ